MASLADDGREGGRSRLLGAVALVLLSLVTVYLPTGPQQTIAHALRQSVLKPFTGLHAALMSARSRARDFEILRAQMDSAMGFVAARTTLAEENRQLREILMLEERPGVEYLPAALLRSGTAGSESVFRVSAGSAQGVRPFNAVVTTRGLLGQIQQVQGGYSLAIDWSHPDFRASAMTADGENHGLVEPERGRFREQDGLVLSGVDFLSDLEPGTEILTSGRGGAFPRGIRIGWVAGVAETLAGWSRSYHITPSVYPGAVTHAAVTIDTGGSGGASAHGTPADSAVEGPP